MLHAANVLESHRREAERQADSLLSANPLLGEARFGHHRQRDGATARDSGPGHVPAPCRCKSRPGAQSRQGRREDESYLGPLRLCVDEELWDLLEKFAVSKSSTALYDDPELATLLQFVLANFATVSVSQAFNETLLKICKSMFGIQRADPRTASRILRLQKNPLGCLLPFIRPPVFDFSDIWPKPLEKAGKKLKSLKPQLRLARSEGNPHHVAHPPVSQADRTALNIELGYSSHRRASKPEEKKEALPKPKPADVAAISAALQQQLSSSARKPRRPRSQSTKSTDSGPRSTSRPSHKRRKSVGDVPMDLSDDGAADDLPSKPPAVSHQRSVTDSKSSSDSRPASSSAVERLANSQQQQLHNLLESICSRQREHASQTLTPDEKFMLALLQSGMQYARVCHSSVCCVCCTDRDSLPKRLQQPKPQAVATHRLGYDPLVFETRDVQYKGSCGYECISDQLYNDFGTAWSTVKAKLVAAMKSLSWPDRQLMHAAITGSEASASLKSDHAVRSRSFRMRRLMQTVLCAVG